MKPASVLTLELVARRYELTQALSARPLTTEECRELEALDMYDIFGWCIGQLNTKDQQIKDLEAEVKSLKDELGFQTLVPLKPRRTCAPN